MTRLLWHSNAPWAPTGYGAQTALFAPRLADHYDLAISSFYGLDGSRLVWNDITVYPGLSPDYGGLFLAHHAKDHFDGDVRGGLVVTLLDVWVLPPQMAAQLNMACWVPVDHEPVPHRVTNFFAQSNAVPVAMSRFGQRQLQAAGLDPLYVPHGVDTEAYQPRDIQKDLLGLPEGCFLVGMVAANKGAGPSRKGFQQAFEAFAALYARHPEAILYLHTVMEGEFSQGEDLWRMLQAFGIPREAVRVSNQYKLMWNPYTPVEMSVLYSSFDVLLHPSMGEGFGVPLLEAQACGTPVIVTDFSSMPEVGAVGWHVSHRPFWTGQGAMQVVADTEAVLQALEARYCQPEAEVIKMSQEARKHALGYDVDRVLDEFMLPALGEVEARFEDRAPLEAVAA